MIMRHRKLFAATFVFALLGWVPAWAPAWAEEVKIKQGPLTLNGELTIAKDKSLKDGIVLLVHGTLAHNAMDTIKNLAGTLNERGVSTLAVNLSLGLDDRHGMYDCKVPHRHHHLDALGEIGLWVKWLKEKVAGDITLFAHSRGGNQATRYATETADPGIKRLVLLAPATFDAKAAAAGFERTHKQPLAAVLAKAEALVKAGKGAEMMPKVGLLYCPEADAAAATFVSYYKPDPRFDTPSILKELKVPALVVAGGKDTVVRGLPERVKPMADGKRLSFGLVGDADHFFLDLYAEDVADLIEKFLSPGT
jgi:pimeloyl-ACP methyl ester carboxylesterase